MKRLTPRHAARIVRDLDAGLRDPMTRHYGAGEFVTLAFNDTCRRAGVTTDEVYALACLYAEQQHAKRIRHRNAARINWKVQQSLARTLRAISSALEPADDAVPF